MKYLIYCGPGIGDWILILPMARRIKESDKDAFIMTMVRSDSNRIGLTKELQKLQSYIDEVDYYSANDIKHDFGFLVKIGIKKYDYGFVLQYTDSKFTSEWPGIIVNIAAKKTCGIKLSYKPNVKYDYEIVREEGIRIVDYSMRMLDKVGIGQKADYTQEEFLNKELLIKGVEKLDIPFNEGKLVALVLGTAPVSGVIDGVRYSNPAKNWPYENWLSLAAKFEESGYKVLLLGGKKELQEMEEVCDLSKLPSNIMNLVGKSSIVESMGVILNSKITIGADTGLMHCAGALGVTALTLFGCTDYREYLAYGKHSYYIKADCECAPCFGNDQSLKCNTYECMKKVQVDKVFDYALSLISARN